MILFILAFFVPELLQSKHSNSVTTYKISGINPKLLRKQPVEASFHTASYNLPSA